MLKQNGHHIYTIPIGPKWKQYVLEENWVALEQLIITLFLTESFEGQSLRKFFYDIHPYKKFEYMIAIRDSKNPDEEDGIWHDDGSRLFACSISLNLNPQNISGGVLGIRKKDNFYTTYIPTPEFGDAIVFLTGKYNYEHRIHKVTSGRRIIMVGWFS